MKYGTPIVSRRSRGNFEVAVVASTLLMVALWSTWLFQAVESTKAAIRPVEPLTFTLWAGPAIGAIIGLLFLRAVIDGRRIAPFTIPEATALYTLRSGQDAGRIMRSFARRQFLERAMLGLITGALVGLLVSLRLPGDTKMWALTLAGLFAAGSLAIQGLAVLASASRLTLPVAVGALSVGSCVSVLDLVSGSQLSPLTHVGRTMLAPLGVSRPSTVVLVLGAAALVGIIGTHTAGRVSLEATGRRSDLDAELRTALSLYDVRTAVLVSRRRRAETFRSTPRFRWSPRRSGTRGGLGRRWMASAARWPGRRLFRLMLLSVASAYIISLPPSPRLAWIPLCAAPLLWLLTLDAMEPLNQEVDRPGARGIAAPSSTRLIALHTVLGAIVITAVVAGGTVISLVLLHSNKGLGILALLIAPVIGIGAAVSGLLTASRRPVVLLAPHALLSPELAFAKAAWYLLRPIVVASIGLLPLAIYALGGSLVITTAATALSGAVLVGIAAIIVSMKLRTEPI